MLFRNLLTTILLFITLFANANTNFTALSEQSKVVMFTCGSGTELYAGFGHSAIWVSDTNKGIDRLFNYGTFDFNTPNFYWKFIRGKLNYMLSVTTLQRFINEYDYRKIEVSAQILNLSPDEKQTLYELLETNALPENRSYKYDFFYDNCATRIRDIVVEASIDEIDFNTADQHLSFREMLFPYLAHTPWTKLGINIILGLSSDKIATPNQYMFLPEYMHQAFESAIVNTDNNQHQLVDSNRKVLESGLEFSYNLLSDPILIFGLIFLLVGLLTLIEIKKKRYFKAFDLSLNIMAIVAGLFFLFMWLGTDHSATNYNMNILWLLPAQAIFVVSMFFDLPKRKKGVQIAFYTITAIILAMFFWPQKTEISFFIIALTYGFRYLFYQRTAIK